MSARRGGALVLALFGAVYLAPGLPRSATAEPATQVPSAAGPVGVPGPSAVGVPVDPHRLSSPATGGTPAADREVSRRFPVDQATFERRKEQANAEATAEEVVP